MAFKMFTNQAKEFANDTLMNDLLVGFSPWVLFNAAFFHFIKWEVGVDFFLLVFITSVDVVEDAVDNTEVGDNIDDERLTEEFSIFCGIEADVLLLVDVVLNDIDFASLMV